MKKPSRETVKNAAIATALVGGTIGVTVVSYKLVNVYYKTKIDLLAWQYLVALMHESHPELVQEFAAQAEKNINEALQAAGLQYPS